MSLVLHRDRSTDPAMDQALTVALLRDSARTGVSRFRCYAPTPAVAFGRSDRLRTGFSTAADAAEAAGFDVVVRAPGGHAVAYHEQCLVLDHILTGPDPRLDIRGRFEEMSVLLVEAFSTIGVSAQIGALEGEYCEGEFSVHGAGVKLVGTAQRVIKGAALVSAVIVVADPDPLREVLVDVYAGLDLALDPRTVGALSTVEPNVSVETVRDAVLSVYDKAFEFREEPIPEHVREAARTILADHRRA